ncbi:MAG: hypothetical protein NTY66_03195 [Candidatus Vogelbacteria bacterium]|nr:hypothetical protein [Candidatus Vogelbacteria bacterium]
MDDLKIKDLQAKIAAIQKDNKVDLSSEEDLSIAIMNLISLEEHFFFSGAKTGKGEYYDLMNETREIRKQLLAKLMDENEAESWCISKHLLAATMRMMEVGTKYQKDGKKEEAEKIFKQAFHVYSMFWALRLKIVDTAGLKTEKGVDDIDTSKPWTAEDIVNRLVNCCKE